MPWYRFHPGHTPNLPPPPSPLYLWDSVTGEPEEERNGRLFAEAAPRLDRLNWPHGYVLEPLEGHPPVEAREAVRAHYEELMAKAMSALANLEPPPRCPGCGCLLARVFGGLENHEGDCPWFPL